MKSPTGWIVAALLATGAPSARASHGPLDTVVVLNSMSLPALALHPSSGERHLAYLSDGILQHTWESGGVWQTEAIVDSASLTGYTGFQLQIAPDGHPVAAYVRKGTLVCAVREAGGWDHDTLDVMPGPFYPIALALSPITSEPAVAWALKSASPAMPSRILYARRSGGAWTVQQVDTVSSYWLTVALGLDGAGRPHVAWGRPRADARSSTVLTHAMGAGPDGPFTAAAVDSELSYFLALEVDPSNGEPRLAYEAVQYDDGSGSTLKSIRYAFRVPGGAWQWMTVTPVGGWFPYSAPALALDPAGNPFISFTWVTAIEPYRAVPAEPGPVEACRFIQTGDIRVYSRAGGAGSGPFTAEFLSYPQQDARSGLSAIASVALNEAIVSWRSPGVNCAPLALTCTRVAGPSAVSVIGDAGSPLALVTPNPARAGDVLRVSFALSRSAEVALDLHDLAGRRTAVRSAEPLAPGRQAVTWQLPPLRPGLYWITVRANEEPLGTTPVMILR